MFSAHNSIIKSGQIWVRDPEVDPKHLEIALRKLWDFQTACLALNNTVAYLSNAKVRRTNDEHIRKQDSPRKRQKRNANNIDTSSETALAEFKQPTTAAPRRGASGTKIL